ncbi:MAG: hypothetical protein FJW40_01085 [Acidobacteria bacterium]|nr:hypothetical protein [Acidobacteriota bacterium]
MRSHISALVVAVWPALASQTYRIEGPAGAWPAILESLGLVDAGQAKPDITVGRGAAALLRIVVGEAPEFGVRAGSKKVPVRGVVDQRMPSLQIVWEQPADLPVFELPAGARVFSYEKRSRAPLLAGIPSPQGPVLWLAVDPGKLGYERFPYLPQALADLGFSPPRQARTLWAFFDSSYRLHVDVDYFARKWRRAGIAALHVAAWHYHEPSPERDEYLRKLIAACHRQAIQVYAWVELPHVSEEFWRLHPEWRERTAQLTDAHLDWRKLINLQNPAARAAVSQGLTELIARFDWDGVNLGELYFESLEGYANPARFTPMNGDVRADFQKKHGFDPLDLFQGSRKGDTAGMRQFLEYRAALAGRMQEEWIGVVELARRGRPDLDLVLTHIDDRFDPNMRDLLGADATHALPLLEKYDFTFLIEDPATVWHLGPQRYPEIARRYQPLTRRPERLAIDINIVERYQIRTCTRRASRRAPNCFS